MHVAPNVFFASSTGQPEPVSTGHPTTHATSQEQEVTGLYDTELFIRRAFGDNPQKGCELLFRLYHKPMCNHAVRFVYSKEVAEDLVADVFYTFWNSKAYLSVKQSFRAYLFRSVRNRAYNFLTNEFKKTSPLELADRQEASPANQPECMMRYNELCHKVDELVTGLPPQCRNTFIMNRFEGKRARQIAEEMQISVRTVEVHIAKALAILREGLKNQWLLTLLIAWAGNSLDRFS